MELLAALGVTTRLTFGCEPEAMEETASAARILKEEPPAFVNALRAGLALGFAVSVKETVGFYTSIGPWFKETFTDTALIGWKILSFLCCPAGIVLYFVWYRTKPEMAKICGKCGIWGVLLWILLIWAILGLAL